MTPRFWDPPPDISRATLPQLVDRLTAHVEQEIVRTLGANALLRLQLEDGALMDRTWHMVPDGETWLPRTPADVWDETVTVADAARLVGVDSHRLHRAIKRGRASGSSADRSSARCRSRSRSMSSPSRSTRIDS